MNSCLKNIRTRILCLALCAGGFVSAAAQDVNEAQLSSFRVDPASVLSTAVPVIELSRNVEAQDFEGALVEEALNFNLGVKITPVAGLNLQADAWRQEISDAPAVTLNTGAQKAMPNLYLKESAINEFNIQSPLLGSQLERNGFDLGASYMWDTNRFGQFTLSTKATYVQDAENRGSLLDLLNSESAALVSGLMSAEVLIESELGIPGVSLYNLTEPTGLITAAAAGLTALQGNLDLLTIEAAGASWAATAKEETTAEQHIANEHTSVVVSIVIILQSCLSEESNNPPASLANQARRTANCAQRSS